MPWVSTYDKRYREITKKWKRVKSRELGSRYTPIFIALYTAGRGKWAIVYNNTREASVYIRTFKRRKDAEKAFRKLSKRRR